MQKEKIEQISMETYKITKKDINEEKGVVLEENLKKFDQDRKKFELEKLKFLEEKSDWEKIRLQRFERYRKQLQEQKGNDYTSQDTDNIKMARKLVIDYNDKNAKAYQELNNSFEIEVKEKNFRELEAEKDEPEKITENKSVDSTEEFNNSKDQEDYERKDLITEIDGELLPFSKFLKTIFLETIQMWNLYKTSKKREWYKIKACIRKCLSEVIILIIFCGVGGMLFKFIEGNYENMYKCGVKRVKRDFIDQLWLSSHNLR
jgi:hypothetical protein